LYVKNLNRSTIMNWEDNKWTWIIGAIVVLVVLYFIFL